jgi:hypothetical protein
LKPVDDRHQQYCPNCSGVSPMGGNCSSCMAIMAAAERAGTETYQQQGCPSCGTPSGGGLVCSSCLMVTTPVDEEILDYLADNDDVDVPKASYEKEDHHLLPRQFRDKFEDAGVDFNMYAVSMSDKFHDAIHIDGWNADWNMFFEMYEQGNISPTIDDIMDFAEFMLEKFGFSDAEVHPYGDKGGYLGPYKPQTSGSC